MKTISLKADADFDALLSRLAAQLKTTRSGVIREAVQHYERQLERDVLRRQLRAASRKTRVQAGEVQGDLDSAVGDGL